MPYPNTKVACDVGFHKTVVESYLAQLYLRKHLHNIYRILYAPGIECWPQSTYTRLNPGKDEIKTFNTLRASLSNMKWVPMKLQFSPDDTPATDILGARLRAKYWGTKVITYRPVNKHILSFSCDVNKMADPINPEIINFAHKGIKALVESTRAFHGVSDERLIITNVFGTAHA